VYHVTVGSDTYGRVKKVGTTPIVTRFGMISSLPVYPLESFYFVRFGERTSHGIPFFAEIRSTEVRGVPLARIDKLSVAMAYLRGLFGALVLFGFVGTFMASMMWITGEHLDELAMLMAKCVGLCFVGGIIGGGLTYAVPLTTQREKEIRRLCVTIFGISLDPARVRRDYARKIESFLDGFPPAPGEPERALELARTRVRIALGEPKEPLEDHTDDLLERIRVQEVRLGM
jgi:hypothetical protein